MIFYISRRRAFTLIEMLIVLAIFSILAAIALPTVRDLLADQKISRGTRGLATFIDIARNRAIAENRQVGVLIERLDNTGGSFGSAASIRVRQLTSVPVYTGDSSNAVMAFTAFDTGTKIATATFDASDSQLLELSGMMVGDERAPIRIGDFVELPGGRLVPILTLVPTPPIITFDLSETDGDGTPRFPNASLPVSIGTSVRYKIHRRPVESSTTSFSLPRGVTIDLNYSGIGVSGFDFAPSQTIEDVSIVFATDGSIASVNDIPPSGNIFLCIGELDGIRSDDPMKSDLFVDLEKEKANIMNLDSLWLAMNAATGRTVSAPFASVSTTPTGNTDFADPTWVADFSQAMIEARFLANLSDTVDLE